MADPVLAASSLTFPRKTQTNYQAKAYTYPPSPRRPDRSQRKNTYALFDEPNVESNIRPVFANPNWIKLDSIALIFYAEFVADLS